MLTLRPVRLHVGVSGIDVGRGALAQLLLGPLGEGFVGDVGIGELNAMRPLRWEVDLDLIGRDRAVTTDHVLVETLRVILWIVAHVVTGTRD
jgi:hypothetical protein